MFKNRLLVIFVLGVVLIVVIGAAGIFAAENEAGTAVDPVVTKSYVDELFASISGSESTSDIFEVVEVSAGAKLVGRAGTEMILRGGKATAIDNGKDGISDLTAGKDLKMGTAISMNHLLLIPKDDGRGIYCTIQSWVMVKGEYIYEKTQ
jgi:hypothetical protein